MQLTAIDFILTITRDDLPPSVLIQWTQAASVAAAAVRKKITPRPQGITQIMEEIGWVMQSWSELSVELTRVRDAISTPPLPLLDSFLDVLEVDVPADAASLLDWWWTNACTAAQGSIAYVAVLDISGDEPVVDLRSVSLPAPAWSWLARVPSLQASTTRSQMVLNPVIYEQIAKTLEQKSSALTDHVRTVTVATGSR